MKRILGIVSSQRVAGNSEILTKAAMEATGPDHKKELIRLTDLDIKSCKGCYNCLPPDVPCHIKDDLNYLLDKIRDADAVVLAAPSYFLGPQGSIKMLQDRFLSISNSFQEFSGKHCITIATYGMPGAKGYTEVALNVTARFLNLNLIDSDSFIGASPAEVLEDPRNLDRARQMGRGLIDPGYKRTPKVSECPVCWSDILRYDGSAIICPFCGTKGEIKVEEQVARLVFSPQADHRFSDEGRRQHFDVFLNRKKQEFIAKRHYYKKLQAPYLSMDWWVSPPGGSNSK
ncbi:MAG: flavodoxin family protein [Desulfotomaculaceae bacterium]|nr:flavodoxin family protein [Desulfotomaculaceae bacterium]